MSTGLSDSLTLSEVVAAIKAGRVLHFAEIPAHHMCERTAIAWLDMAYELSMGVEASFGEVPLECRTATFMMLAAKMGCSVLAETTPEQCSNYRGLAETSISAKYSALYDLDCHFRDQKMVEFVFACWPRDVCAIAQMCPWVIEFISDDLLNKYAHQDPLFALAVPPERLQEPLCRYMSLHIISDKMPRYRPIREMGRLDLLAIRVGEGDWFYNYRANSVPRPASLDQAVAVLGELSSRKRDEETMYMSYIMSFPIEQVVPAMKGSRLKALLLEMYSMEALAPFLKGDVGLRGVMLERALGL
jgi:hypothetical protein